MSNIDTKIAAIIMIGGLSSRMGGGIKSLNKFNNKKIFDRILEKTQPQIKKIIINCNAKEEEFEKYNLPIIKDIKQGYIGPLAGIHAALKWVKSNNSNPSTDGG